MNWYKFAMKIPPHIDKMSHKDMWFSPDGKIFPIFPFLIHDDWVDHYEDFLMSRYNIPIPLDQNIIKNNWIRFTGGIVLSMEVYQFTHKILNNLSNILFDNALDIPGNKLLQIENHNNESAEFTWEDFLKSGLSFFDFTKKEARRNKS